MADEILEAMLGIPKVKANPGRLESWGESPTPDPMKEFFERVAFNLPGSLSTAAKSSAGPGGWNEALGGGPSDALAKGAGDDPAFKRAAQFLIEHVADKGELADALQKLSELRAVTRAEAALSMA